MMMMLLDELTQLLFLLLGNVALVALNKGQQTLMPQDRQLPTVTQEPAHIKVMSYFPCTSTSMNTVTFFGEVLR